MHHDGARSAPQPEQPPTLEALVTRGPSRTTLAAPRWGKAVQGQIAFEVTTSDLAIVASPHTTRSEEVTDAPGERAELALECPNSLTDCVPFSTKPLNRSGQGSSRARLGHPTSASGTALLHWSPTSASGTLAR